MDTALDAEAIRAVVEGEHGDPFAVLGPHCVQTPDGAAVAVRAIVPGAAAVRILPADAPPTSMERLHPANGIWEIFVPGLGEDERYKFEIRGRSAEPLALKSDPYALAFEAETPRTASVVANLNDFQWRDEAWLAERARRHPLREPVS